MPLGPEAARALLTQQLDATLARWVIGGKERAMLTGVRGYVQAMTAGELTKLATFLPATMKELPTTTEENDPMAKKTNAAAPALSAEHKALAQRAGIDLSKIDLTKLAQLIQLILAIIGQVSTPAQLTAAGVKAREGSEDDCCGCLEAAGLAVQSAQVSLSCCQGMCETGG